MVAERIKRPEMCGTGAQKIEPRLVFLIAGTVQRVAQVSGDQNRIRLLMQQNCHDFGTWVCMQIRDNRKTIVADQFFVCFQMITGDLHKNLLFSDSTGHQYSAFPTVLG